MVRPPGFEPAPRGLRALGDTHHMLNEFREFCRVDLRLSTRTIQDGHVPFVEEFNVVLFATTLKHELDLVTRPFIAGIAPQVDTIDNLVGLGEWLPFDEEKLMSPITQ